jgi:hypothetical protein
LGLTELKIKDLHDKKFDDLYTEYEAEWIALAASAYDFTKAHISKGEPLADDVLKTLLPMLEVNERLRKHQEDNHARYKRFREFFGEYIIEQKLFKKTEVPK